jgi:hypothetical protein
MAQSNRTLPEIIAEIDALLSKLILTAEQMSALLREQDEDGTDRQG